MPGMRPSFAQKSLLRLLPSTWCGAVDAPQRNPGASSVIVECLPDANSYHVVGFRWNVDRDRQAGKGAGWFRNLSVTRGRWNLRCRRAGPDGSVRTGECHSPGWASSMSWLSTPEPCTVTWVAFGG